MKPQPIDILDLALRDLQRRSSGVRFVQIGAHDGVTLDPITPYVKEFCWRGVAVEPQREMFLSLQENYIDDDVRCENCAVSRTDGEATLYTFSPHPSLPYHATMLASFNRDALVHNGHGYSGEIIPVTVPVLSPVTLMRKHNFDKVDLLQVDTEGHDFTVITSFFEARIHPTLIHFESALMSPVERDALDDAFCSVGYRVTPMGIDTLAYLQANTGSFMERASMSGL